MSNESGRPETHMSEVTWDPIDFGRVSSAAPMLAVLYSETPRTWRKRLFSLPWRPWKKYPDPVYVDLKP